MRGVVSFALIAACALPFAQVAPLPAVGKAIVYDLKTRETSACAYVQIGSWDRPFGLRATAYAWTLAGLDLSDPRLATGFAGVISSHGVYGGVAALVDSGQPVGAGLIVGVSGKF